MKYIMYNIAICLLIALSSCNNDSAKNTSTTHLVEPSNSSTECQLRDCLTQLDVYLGNTITVRGYLRSWSGQLALFEGENWQEFESFKVDALRVADLSEDVFLLKEIATGDFRCTRRYVEITGELRIHPVLKVPHIKGIKKLVVFNNEEFSDENFICIPRN